MATDSDSPIRVVVTPSQSSYFAGETLSVTITFTNTRTRSPEGETDRAGPSRSARTHKRASHSISSAPIARPPTSPGWDDENLETKSASYTQRSFSVDTHLLRACFLYHLQKFHSPLARSETLPLSSKHPHARKQSVMDGTHFSYPPNDVSASPTSPTSATSTSTTMFASPTSVPPTPSASSSSFSLALDPIAEVSPLVSAYPYLSPAPTSGVLGPSLSSPSIAIEAPSPPSASLAHPSYPPHPSNPPPTRQNHRPPKIGLGTVTLAPIPSNDLSISSSTKSFTSPRMTAQSPLLPFPPSPHLASPVPAAPLSPAQIEQQKAQTLNALRHALLKGSATAVGGGSMDITSRTHSRTPSAGGAASLGGGLGSGSWGSFGASTSAGPVSAYGPFSAKPSLETINSGSTDGPAPGPSSPALPSSANTTGTGTGRRPHSRSSSFSSGLMSILASPFGLGGSGSPLATYAYGEHGQVPMSAPPVSNLAASKSTPNVNTGIVSAGLPQRPHLQPRNRALSAGLTLSSSSGWPSASVSSPLLNGIAPGGASAGGSSSRLGLGLGWPLGLGASKEELIDPEVPLPTFEVQSAMLAVDVTLEPGESRSYSYSILLPSNLPPTFRGRTFRFAYELVVGICRSSSDGASVNGDSLSSAPASAKGKGPGGSVSKVMKVPIRVYTNVVVGRSPTPYDLLWPAIKRRSTPVVLGHRRGGRMPSSANKDRNKMIPMLARSSSSIRIPRPSRSQNQNTVIVVSDSSSSLTLSTLGTGHSQDSGSGSGSLNELKDYARCLVDELLPECAEPTEQDSYTSTAVSAPTSISASNSGDNRELSPLVEETTGEGEAEAGEEGESESKKVNGNGNGNANTNPPPVPIVDLAWKEKERIAARLTARQREESEDPIPVGGCGEAVEILTRNPKKVSYDVNKDGVKVAVLTFIKSAFRLGETIQGVVELNERRGRARVVQLSAHLETYESLPPPISTTPNNPTATRQLKRSHAEHHSSFVLETLRTTFTKASSAVGGLEWKVRLCLLVAVAKEASDVGTEGVRFKSLVRDGPRGEWGSAWKAPARAGPCEKPVPVSDGGTNTSLSENVSSPGVVKSWASFIAASFLGSAEGGYHDGDDLSDDYSSYNKDDDGDEDRTHGFGVERDDYDGIKPNHAGGVGTGVNFCGGKEDKWKEVALETVECEVPVRVWPGNTAFKPVDVMFDV
ncbi:Rgp1-domain-containing protein [Gymnopus androsaceus JB14]|uniref:Rgp1-domain-containing protein n=1 Tax=Gymnopus androsaceus JB14 TaxID=1447944 RepID=A0A6A4I1V7_9AGAR|nr:Rgp1-domain-containing protein [Gymnopus androsaceus JB14]